VRPGYRRSLSLKSQGRGYQTRINAILREAMLKALPKKTEARLGAN
jgi:hypothetical protein